MKTTATLAILAAMLASPARGLAQPSKIVDWSFLAGSDGNSPRGTLLASGNGFYGTTAVGGPAGNGTVFHLTPQIGSIKGSEQTIWTFTGAGDGSIPSAGLLADSTGALYGTAAVDGARGAGTVFRLNPPAAGSTAWTETTLWGFSGHEDGARPLGGVIADRSGNGVLYGTTRFGGAHNLGVVFSLTPPVSGQGVWTETTLWSFTGRNTGAKPQGALLQDSIGALYGTTVGGGAYGNGAVFKLRPPRQPGGGWTPSLLWSFGAGAGGANPQGTLIADLDGALYGTAAYGGRNDCPAASWPYYDESPSVTAPTLDAPYVTPGENGCGVVFRLSPPALEGEPWTQSVLWSFTGGNDGDNPVSELLAGPSGTLYGTVPLTADGSKGILYKLTPPGQAGGAYTETTLQAFTHELQGSYPRSGVVPGQDGRLYGTNAFGGSTWVHVKVYGYGTIYGALP